MDFKLVAREDELREEIVMLKNHLAFAYYFSLEARGDADLKRARELLHQSIALNGNLFPRLLGYAYCILGQMEILDGTVEAARGYFTKAYLLYTYQTGKGELNRDIALHALGDMTKELPFVTGLQDRSDLYQRAIVLEFFADNETRDGHYVFAKQCYLLCANFVRAYWGKNTLQVGDIFYRLGKLKQRQNQTVDAREWFAKALDIYLEITGPDHLRSRELIEILRESQVAAG